MEKGYIHIYTGNGKGKTTAAFGLALRAACADKKVFIAQFVKGMKYSEVKVCDLVKNIDIEQFGLECFIKKEPKKEDIEIAKKGLEKIKKIVENNAYDVLVLDEINIALYYDLFKLSEVLDILSNKPQNMEIICTGRYAKDELIEFADLVTEMKEIKHYFNEGVEARRGIEC